jgi:endonuclease/exonuclease/phosphatase family metal-dependent hydrolase
MRAIVIACLAFGCSTAASNSAPDAASPKPDSARVPDAAPDAFVDGFVEATPNEPTGALCDIAPDYVALGGDPYRPPCAIEIGSYRDPELAPKTTLRVVAWNVEFGNNAQAIVDALTTRPELADADVLLLSEVPRASLTSNPQNIDLAKQLAISLHRSYAFAVEWDRREVPGELGEHGVAVISRYPIGKPRQLRHVQLNDWYSSDHLYGGRPSLGVDIDVGGHVFAAYVSHFDTRGLGDTGRAMQSAELRADATAPGRPAIVVDGGDFNTWNCNPLVADCTVAPSAEQTVKDFLAEGWSNGDGSWNGISHYGNGFFPQRLDWAFYRGPGSIPGEADAGAGGSDHLPIYFDLKLQP